MILIFYQLIIKQQTAVPLLQMEPAEVVWASNEDETLQYTLNLLEGLYAPCGLKTPQYPPGGTGKHCWRQGCQEFPA